MPRGPHSAALDCRSASTQVLLPPRSPMECPWCVPGVCPPWTGTQPHELTLPCSRGHVWGAFCHLSRCQLREPGL